MLTLRFPKSALGPIVDVAIQPSFEAVAHLKERGLPAPGPLLLKMLVDTGAEQTALDETKIAPWGLVYVGMSFMGTMTGTKPVRTYDLRLELSAPGASAPWAVGPIVVMARQSVFDGLPYSGLVGRDVLDRSVFTYDGPGHVCIIEASA